MLGITRRQTVRNSILASLAAVLALLAVAHVADLAAQQARQRVNGEGFISEGIPKMPNPPGPAPKRDLAGVWVGPGTSNKPDPAPPMTPAGEAIFKQRKAYNLATNLGSNASADPGASNDPAIKCDPLGFPRNVQTYAITNRGGVIFGSAPNRILIAYEQNRLWREIWMDGRALPKAVDVKGAPESRYYGYSVGHWEGDNTLVIDTTGLDERPWLDTVGHPRSSMALITERYTRVDQYNIQVTLTVTDPKYYSKPWTFMRASLYWMKAQEFPETLCIPSEAIEYLDTLAKPSGIQIVP
ncbi:MAG: hypothetical protein DMF87_01045 [Acidobacteria bacterium]|nr:MAG: hypothetical protein DMF87_01045 [Acidobacteriota bacterium]